MFYDLGKLAALQRVGLYKAGQNPPPPQAPAPKPAPAPAPPPPKPAPPVTGGRSNQINALRGEGVFL